MVKSLIKLKVQAKAYFESLQKAITEGLLAEDPSAALTSDHWLRPEGGGGTTNALSAGKKIEKGGVAFSAVEGKTHAAMLKQLNIETEADFFATGVSLVIHPLNPWAPIIHMNVRYFELSNGTKWFGGGIDLTPHYIHKEDATYFHQSLRKICNDSPIADYNKFKAWADDYFYLPHRQETRGIGGIFFDHLGKDTDDLSQIFSFVKTVGNAFLPIYTHLLNKNSSTAFNTYHTDWQRIRRGRYVEFNLAWDRGTKFGLETNGRTESILMSMPPMAVWQYNHTPPENSLEADTLSLLKKGIDWASL